MSTAESLYALSFRPAVRHVPRPLVIINVRGTPDPPRRAVRLIQEGGLLAYPTDTAYGLGCDISNAAAVRRVFEVKRRPLDEPLPVLVAEVAQAWTLAASRPPLAERLAARFWPGALTLVLPRGRRVPALVAGGGETVALRVPDHPIPRNLVRLAGVPIVGTSANLHGDPTPTRAEHVVFSLGDRIDMLLDGGPTPRGRESTIVDLTEDPPRVLREGAIPRRAVEEALGWP
ncbi:MAG: L-threonylcarbamoyladenylate synthase [Armatimonadota bacterium]|nr:L-threonylcarbamoyladenylate synthase [Armatimonadota bacterium]MDR7447943.1 L-threonylcarbamoyladenylate synthase [Armatimonadota bacterium]MDR7458207.1 L-threonylcarbamoyladenylate synthase [Armatimonadota bacterium]MDR7478488.1 L-threonylcarbamoyladenylate synthase [Armatimonadota bacterium]MDR7488757.1 L-threonylcarbamoyladenylate synthase [Armatimonadota bacterium]